MNKNIGQRRFALLLILVFIFLAACSQPAPAEPAESEEADTSAEAAEPVEEEAAEEPAEESAEEPAEEEMAEEEPAEEPADAGQDEEETTIEVAINVDIDTFDHQGYSTIAVANVIDYMVETLVKVTPEGEILPNLAKDWEISEDGLEYTIYLQEGVEFHDGTPFNAEAVEYNIDRIKDPDVQTADTYPYDQITEVEIVDEYTLKWYLEEPINSFVENMLQTNFGMMSPAFAPEGSEQYIAVGTSDGTVGTGPYVFESFSPGDRVVLLKNENYWGEEPYYDKIIFYIAPDPATRESMLLSGQVDVAVLPPITDVPALQANPDVTVTQVDSNRYLYVAFNQDTELLQDVRVRQALNYAVDKEAIIENIMFGAATLMDSPIPYMYFGYCPTGDYAYNPERAKELLEEAGVPEGTEFEFWAPTGRYVQDFQVAEAISGYFSDIGIVAVPQTFEWGTYIESVLNYPENREDRPDMYMLGFGGTAYHASHSMYLYESDGFFNGHNYSNPEIDALAQEAISAPDRERSAEAYCEIANILWEDAPLLYLHLQAYTVAHDSDITGISGRADEKINVIPAHPVE